MNNPSVFLVGREKAKVGDRPLPLISDPHDVIVRIKFVGVCGSDVHFWKHGGIETPISQPLVMGHEASGIVESVGSAVTSVKVGDHVAIEPGHPCRRCLSCKGGVYNLCAKMKFAAAPPESHGTLTKLWMTPEDFVYKIPDGISLQEAVLVEPLSVAVHASRLASIQTGDIVVIIGSGTIGLLCAAVAKTFGAFRIILIDIIEQKLKFAHEYLDVETHLVDVDASPEDNTALITESFDLLGGVSVVIEASGTESSTQLGIYLLKHGGKFVQAGLGKPKVQVPMLVISGRELRILGCFRYAAGDFDLAIGLVARRQIVLNTLISSITPFERAWEAWGMTGSGIGIKNLIQGPLD